MDAAPITGPAQIDPDASLHGHPVRLDLTDRSERSRLTVLFRLLLTLPHLIWLLLWTVFALAAVALAWVAALASGQVPLALHRFLAAWIRYSMHVAAFLSLVGGPFPGFVGSTGSYPVDLSIDPPRPQRRLVTLFRGVLVIPALMLASAHIVMICVVALLGWPAAFFGGRMPEGMRDLGAVGLRYCGQATAYLFLLTDRYPSASPGVEQR